MNHDDLDLVRRFLDGNQESFAELVARHRNRVFAIAFRICGRREDALDVAQDVFLTAFRKLSMFRQEALLTTWLHRLAVNAALDLARKRSRREYTPLDDVPDAPDPSVGPEDRAIEAHRAAAVHRALGLLSPEYRAVIVLHDLHDLDYPGVADALGIPLGTVKSRIHRARLELAKTLRYLEPEDPSQASKLVRDDD